MQRLALLALLAMACTGCKDKPAPDVATMRPTADEINPKTEVACVTVNTGNETYTIDSSGCVQS